MRKDTRLLVNTGIGIGIIAAVMFSIFYFMGKLDVESLNETLASFLPAIFIGSAVLSAMVIVLKGISGIIRFLQKKV